jgi:aminopeptidase YwaD
MYKYVAATLLSFIILILISLLFSAYGVQSGKQPVVKPKELREWISYLASDEMRGRENGSPEMKTAALWISEKFRDYGLVPAGADELIMDYSYKSQKRIIEEKM